MVVILFLLAILGALIAPIFSVPRLLLFLPILFYKRPMFFLGLSIILIVNYMGGINVQGNFEFVGRVVQTNDNFSIVRGKIYYEEEWRNLNLSVGVYKEIPLGDIVYYYGDMTSRKLNYPKVILNKNRVMSSPYSLSIIRKVYLVTESFREELLKYSEVFYGLFGGKIKNNDYYNSGLYHFFSVSGMHVSLLFSFSLLFFSIFGIKRKIRNTISLVIPFVFIVGTGLNLPSLRAFIYLLALVILELLELKFSKLNVLCVVGITFLLLEPSLSYSLSFYMSFFSTFGILSVENKYLKPIAAFLGSAPYLSLFSSINIFSIVGSIIILLPVQAVLILLSLSFLFYLLNFHVLTHAFLYIALPFTKIIEAVSYIFSKLPYIPGSIYSYFFFSFLFFVFLLQFGQIPYILKSKFSKTNP
ncbi:ComEC/Rec2 family competence protein [Thermosipho atlanticus]|uniref:Competence protein ComEC n=1 Tax=Thermosipho atlanticus DSM 15807 TaxID=1123380 RepID=A0A1M5QZN0_9BACT|nr:ComEC/Rec2 family competence protein [Thermosipho atlanticus]SHH19637.1 competence protein ComEC [Thermosipho atlanticus DSM 15807]